jgi:hypothetical protein
MELHPRFHRGGTFYSGFPARHAWCQAWQAGTPARPSDAEHLKDAKYGAACPGARKPIHPRASPGSSGLRDKNTKYAILTESKTPDLKFQIQCFYKNRNTCRRGFGSIAVY